MWGRGKGLGECFGVGGVRRVRGCSDNYLDSIWPQSLERNHQHVLLLGLHVIDVSVHWKTSLCSLSAESAQILAREKIRPGRPTLLLDRSVSNRGLNFSRDRSIESNQIFTLSSSLVKH